MKKQIRKTELIDNQHAVVQTKDGIVIERSASLQNLIWILIVLALVLLPSLNFYVILFFFIAFIILFCFFFSYKKKIEIDFTRKRVTQYIQVFGFFSSKTKCYWDDHRNIQILFTEYFYDDGVKGIRMFLCIKDARKKIQIAKFFPPINLESIVEKLSVREVDYEITYL